MGRFWLGVLLLIAFLILGVWISCFMDQTYQAISDTLQQASYHALYGSSEEAAALVSRARTDWESRWHSIAATADHDPMDEIDGLFAQLPVYMEAGKTTDFAAYCARLSKLVAAMGEAHKLTWWNFL